MKWFKHFSDNHRGQTVQTLLNEFGHSGPCAYYFIMELCAEKLESKDIDSGFVFTFKRPYFDNVLRMKRKSTDNVLRTLSQSGVLKSEANENEVRIEMPILLNLLDRDLKKPRIDRAASAKKPRLDKDKDKDKDKEYNGEKNFSPPVEKNPVQDLIANYCDAWRERYGSNPPITGKVSGIVTAYLSMPDQWFVTKRHDIPTMIVNLNTIAHFIETGTIITQSDLKKLGKALDAKKIVDSFSLDLGEERKLLNDPT
jgi:hypothetical protein